VDFRPVVGVAEAPQQGADDFTERIVIPDFRLLRGEKVERNRSFPARF